MAAAEVGMMAKPADQQPNLPRLSDPRIRKSSKASADIDEGQNSAPKQALHDSAAAAAAQGTASELKKASGPKDSLWFHYKHLAPVPITLVAGVVLTSIMTPYFKDPLIANLIRQHFNPHYIGVKGFDAFLGFVVPFFETMANSETYGIIPLGYFVTTHLGWQMAGAIESSRVDADTNVFVHFYTIVVVVALVIGSYVITPLFWIVAYLSFENNKVRSTALRFEEHVRVKRVRQSRIAAACVVVIVGFTPFLAGMVLSHDEAKFAWNTALFFTTPLLWQLIWSPFGRAPKTGDNERTPARYKDQLRGHRAAMNSLLIVAGGCIAWHMYAILAVVKDPTIVSSLWRVLTHYEGHLHTILFIWVDEIVLWAGFLMIPLAQEGLKAAALFVAATFAVGPGAAVAFYFFWREAAYLHSVEEQDAPPERKKLLRSLSSIARLRWGVHQCYKSWRNFTVGRLQLTS